MTWFLILRYSSFLALRASLDKYKVVAGTLNCSKSLVDKYVHDQTIFYHLFFILDRNGR